MDSFLKLAVFALLAWPAQGSELASLTRPDTNLLIGVRVAEIRDSALFGAWMEESGGSEFDFGGLPAASAKALLEHVEEVLIAGRVDQAGKSAEDEAIILVRGDFVKFDPARELCVAGCTVESHREVGLYRSHREAPDDESPDYLAVLGGHFLAMGKRGAVTEVIDRYVWQSPVNHADDIAEWESRAGSADLWIVASGPFGGVAVGDGAEGGTAAAAAQALEHVHSLGLRLDFANDLDLDVEILSGSNSDARQLYDLLNGFVALLRLTEPGDGDSAGQVATLKMLLDELELTNEGRMVTASLSIPQTELAQALRNEPAAPVVAANAAPIVISGKSGKNEPGRIRIVGLDTGVHAVEVKQTRQER